MLVCDGLEAFIALLTAIVAPTALAQLLWAYFDTRCGLREGARGLAVTLAVRYCLLHVHEMPLRLIVWLIYGEQLLYLIL